MKQLLVIFLATFLFQAKVKAQVEDVSSLKFAVLIDESILKVPVYASESIFESNNDIDKAVVVIHGNNRDAGPYLGNLKTAYKNSTNPINTILIAPQFLTEDDLTFHNLDNEHLYWTSGGWKSGSNSRNEDGNPRPERIPSYAVLDSLLLHLSETFPSLSSIVLVGHSAGAQVTQRMAATSPIADNLCSDFDISMRFVVANPSSYVYMDKMRRIDGTIDQFAIPSTNCGGYNEWKYGLDDLFSYPDELGANAIRNTYKSRSLIYLLGENDNDPNSSSLDTSCEAELQGAHRLERGLNYHNYIKQYYENEQTLDHNLIIVPDAGHNNLDMFDSMEGRFALFEDPIANCGEMVNVKEDYEVKSELTIFPNPASDFISIDVPDLHGNQYVVEIINASGQIVFIQQIVKGGKILTRDFTEGLYFMQAKGQNSILTKSFVVHH